ncbi:unnamed protein product, partial [Tuber aestivum]
LTKVVDRRWCKQNKHIFPARVWTEFYPGTDYSNTVWRDVRRNSFL